MNGVDLSTPCRRRFGWRRIDRANRDGAGWQIYVPSSIANHQPMARESDGGWQPACLCGWVHGHVYEHRTEALHRAYEHDSESA